jgi:hypothetical protein
VADRFPSDDPKDDALFAAYAARSHAAAPASPCPDPNELAALGEGRLVGSEADELSGHLVSCDACRRAVAGVAIVERVPAPRPRSILRLLAPLAAAAVFVAALVVFLDRPRDSREVALAAAKELAAERPDLFAGFEPLKSGRAAPPSPQRGALALLAPAGVVLEARPSFQWEQVPGVARWTVTLFTAEGDPLWTAESAAPALAYPAAETALAPGARYLGEARGAGPLGPERARRAFDVASDDERRAFEESAREIERLVPAATRPLVLAQVALHRGLYADAEREAERFLRDAPDDAFGEETLAAARRAIGRPAQDGR